MPSVRSAALGFFVATGSRGETPAENEPVHVVEYDVATHTTRNLGIRNDRELVYLNKTRAALTGSHRRGSWSRSAAAACRTPASP